MTETFKPYEPEDSGYDYDEYAYEDRRGPNVLWGRIIALIVALALAFWFGRATAGGDDEGQLSELRDELEQAQQENEDLENQLAAAQAETVETPADTATDAATDPAAEEEGETYVVQRGDTLRGIAQTFCGDPQLDDLIASENGIEDATQLSVGEEIVLPAECTG
ncbi:MAG TPA: LysM peptidoglycan-binding domain-containing protein [Actinomycetota bacterium]|nr:LysM peptidoglycan-binding domain-containing protein [Actinomycetota bacterium]